MVASAHSCEFTHRHMAVDASGAFGASLMVRMRFGIIYELFMAGQAGVIWFVLLAESAAGGMAMRATEFAGFNAAVHTPAGKGVIFAEVPAIGIEIAVLECYKIVVVEVSFVRHEACCDGAHFCMAGGAHRIGLVDGEFLCAY